MAKVVLASALSRWLPKTASGAEGETALEVGGATVGEVLDKVFEAIFVDGTALRRKSNLDQALSEHVEVHVMQALSGG